MSNGNNKKFGNAVIVTYGSAREIFVEDIYKDSCFWDAEIECDIKLEGFPDIDLLGVTSDCCEFAFRHELDEDEVLNAIEDAVDNGKSTVLKGCDSDYFFTPVTISGKWTEDSVKLAMENGITEMPEISLF